MEFHWTRVLTSLILMMSSLSFQPAESKDMYLICFTNKPRYLEFTKNDLLVKETTVVKDGKRTCSFEVERGFNSTIRLQLYITKDRSPDCDADEVLSVGEDTSSLQKVCGNQTVSRTFYKSFVVQFSQREVNPKYEGITIDVTEKVRQELLRCNKSLSADIETRTVTLTETFQPGDIEIPYHCWWTFTYPSNNNPYNRLIVDISDVRLQPTTSSSDCGNNSLILRNGWDASHPKVFESCKNDSYQYLTYDGQSAFVEVNIDQPSNLPFTFHVNVTAYSLVECYGQVITLKATSQVQRLESPGYPNEVPQNMRCRWKIESSDGNEVEIELVDTNIDDHCTVDKLEIWDGDQELASICVQRKNNPKIFRSSAQSLSVFLKTDETNFGRGLALNYYTKKFPSKDVAKDTQCRTNLVKLKADSTQRFIESPNYLLDHSDTHDCSWMIESDDGNNVEVAIVNVVFGATTKCTAASLQIFDGPDTNKSPLARECGNVGDVNKIKVRSSGQGIKVIYNSNISGKTGFRLAYYTKSQPSTDLTNLTSCRGHLTQLTAKTSIQYIESEGYPNTTLVRNEDCRWLIHAPGGKVKVEVLAKDIGFNTFLNSITLIQGNKFSGDAADTTWVTRVGQTFESKGDNLMIRYQTDAINNHALPAKGGFRLGYSLIPTPTTGNTGTTPDPRNSSGVLSNSLGTLVTAIIVAIVTVLYT